MNTSSFRSGPHAWLGLVAAVLLCWAESALGVALSISPSSVSNTYTEQITLQISGLTNGETVLINKYLDANTNRVVDTADWLVQHFRLTDNRASVIGGVTNINIPYDSNPTNGAITIRSSILADGIEQQFVGKYLYRLSSPTNRFAASNTAFTVTQATYLQMFNGKVTSGGANIPYAGVWVFAPAADGGPLAETVADGSGSYTLPVPPGAYQLSAFKSGYVCNMDAAPVLNLGAGATITTNLNLIPATRSISGRFVDATNTSSGLPALLVMPGTQDSLLALGFTDTNGNFSIPVTAGEWELGMDEQEFSFYGYLSLQNQSSVNTTSNSVSGITNAFPKGTALFYGRVKDDQNHPLPGIRIEASDNGNQYWGMGTTDSNGNYAVAVVAGGWHIDPDNSSYILSGINTNITNGQAVRVDFTASVGATVSGRVLGAGVPLSDVQVNVGTVILHEGGGWGWDQQYHFRTDSNGNYSASIPPGSNYYAQVNPPQDSLWLSQFYSNATDLAQALRITTSTNAPATNINFNLQRGAQISGRVLAGGSPLENVQMAAERITLFPEGGQNTEGVAWANTDADGYYTLVVPPGVEYGVRAQGPDGTSWMEQYYSNATDAASATLVTPTTNAPATNINFNLQAGAIISGDVLGGGVPLAGIGVQVGTVTIQEGGGWNWEQSYYGADTDSEGHYARVVPPGTNYYAQVNLPQDSTWLRQFYSNATDLAQALRITTSTNAPATNINFNLSRGALISGRVLGGGSPLENVHLEAGIAHTNESGDLQWDYGVAWGDTDSNGDYTMVVTPGTPLVMNARPPDGSIWLQQYYSNAVDVAHATQVISLTNAPATHINFNLQRLHVLLHVVRAGANAVTVSWLAPSTGYMLQQNTNLGTTNWIAPSETISENSTSKFITVTSPTGRCFYRLVHP